MKSERSVEMLKEHKINLRKIPISSSEKASIIRDLVKIIDEFKKEYKAEFILRDLIENEYQSAINQRIKVIRKSGTKINYEILNKDEVLTNLTKKKREKGKIFNHIRMVAEKHYIFHFEFFLKLFLIILDIRDWLWGGSIEEIANKHGFSVNYIKSIAQVVLPDHVNLQYKCRFYHNEDLKEIVLSIAENVMNSKVNPSSFSNLKNPYIQELLEHYQKARQSEDQSCNYTSIGLDSGFIRRISNLSKNKSENILKSTVEILTTTDLLILCSKINRNQEVLKYMVYALINYPDDELNISKIV